MVRQIGEEYFPIAYQQDGSNPSYLMINQEGSRVGNAVSKLDVLLDNAIQFNEVRPEQIQMEVTPPVFEKAKGRNHPAKYLRPLTPAEILIKPRF
ncbi:MAG: hypothetical protein ABH824_00135 [Nanoarchaeota archaeon]|nr:hypothetical protein [Nanoarchaeota archaeon]